MHHKSGFTLIELALVVVLGMILAGAIVPNYVRSLQIEASKKTALEMSQLADAARVYFIGHNAWPSTLTDLGMAGVIDSAWLAQNPFGNAYVLQITGADLVVSTTVLPVMAPVVARDLPMTSVQGAAVSMSVPPPGALADGVPPGAVVPWTALTIPSGWLVCDGHAVSRQSYAGLFAVIGTTYGGGDGTTTFNVPDLRGRVVVGMDNMGAGTANVISEPAANVLGGMFGEEKHQLTIAEMPSHNHQDALNRVYDSGPAGSSPSHRGDADNANNPIRTSFTGGNGAHNNIQPSMALQWIIRS